MARFTASGGTYQEACDLISDLRLRGIESNITAGGVSIYPEPEKVTEMMRVCEVRGFSCKPGFSAHQEDVMLQTDDGFAIVEQITNDARSVLKEFTE